MLRRCSLMLACLLFSGVSSAQVLIDGPEVDLTVEDGSGLTNAFSINVACGKDSAKCIAFTKVGIDASAEFASLLDRTLWMSLGLVPARRIAIWIGRS